MTITGTRSYKEREMHRNPLVTLCAYRVDRHKTVQLFLFRLENEEQEELSGGKKKITTVATVL